MVYGFGLMIRESGFREQSCGVEGLLDSGLDFMVSGLERERVYGLGVQLWL